MSLSPLLLLVLLMFAAHADAGAVGIRNDKEPETTDITVTDMTPPPDSTESDTLVFVPAEEFTCAGFPRATLYGRLPLATTHIDPIRAAIVGSIYGGVWVWLHLNMSDAWWGDRASFRLKDDWNTVLQIDKAGHAYSGYMMSYTLGEGLMAAGIDWETATITGGVLGLLYQSYVELEDGFSENWGFSLTDMVANTLGSGLYVAQYYSPFLQNFTPKYQYVPASWIGAPRLSTTWIDDYNSSTFWISLDIHNLLPEGEREAWPEWLGIAVGYGVNVDESEQTRRYILALDYDLRKILPEGGHVWNWFRQTLNYVKLPAPAVEFGKSTRFRILFPFNFRIGEMRL